MSGNKSVNTTKGRTSGGISFYYRNNIRQHVKIVQTNQFGIIWVKLDQQVFSFDEDVYICHMYIPPSNSNVLQTHDFDFFENLELDIVKYNDLGKVYVTGDLNSRTADLLDYLIFDKYIDQNVSFVHEVQIPDRVNQDRTVDNNGRRLLDTCIATGLVIANGRVSNDRYAGEFTYCSARGQSTLDYLIGNFEDLELLCNFEVHGFNEFSDHSPLLFSLPRKTVNSHSHKSSNETCSSDHIKLVWDIDKLPAFRDKLMNNHEQLLQLTSDIAVDTIDHVVMGFSRLLYSSASEIFGNICRNNKTTQSHGRKMQNKKWFDESCFVAKREFKRARNIFNRKKDDISRQNFITARTHYNRKKKNAKRKFKRDEGKRINELAGSNPRKFWTNIRQTVNKTESKPDSLSLNDLMQHFKELYGETRDDSEIHAHEDGPNIESAYLDRDFSEEEIRSAVFSQKNNKSPGVDNITSEMIKSSYEIISPFLLKLYKHLYSKGEYPRSWGEGIISPIFKKGDLNDASNYRGITLVNVLAKIYSQLLLNRLTNWSTEQDKISKNQFGFQKGKSIVDCIFILHSIISKVLDSGQKLYCIFIDYKQCFDKIDRAFLYEKLAAENVSCKLVKAIKSMYTVVKSCIRYNSAKSEFFMSDIGLKQGDPSSPLLFMLFVNDISENINSDLNDIFTYNELKLFLLLYADDQALFAKSPETLQLMLKDVENYCNVWGLKINTQKTKAMIFEKGRHTTYDFYIYNTRIELVNSFKYLGITLYKNGYWSRTQKGIAQHASFAWYNLMKVLKNVELPVPQKFKLFDTLVASILNFGAELWGHHTAKNIELIHTKFIRHILGVKKSTNLSALYGETARFPFEIQRKMIMLRYWMKILKQDNTSLVKQAYFILKHDAAQNRTYNSNNWAYQLKQFLDSHGFSYVWINQECVDIPYDVIKQRVLDNFKQRWYSDINNSGRLYSYAIFKHEFELEKYLRVIPEGKYRNALSRFRTSSHRLRVETGRYENIARENRICIFCNMNQVENEYHFLLVCPLYRELRRNFLKSYYCHWPTINKFENLISTASSKMLNEVAKFIYFAMEMRNAQ